MAFKRTASYSRRLTPAAALQPSFSRFVWLQIGKIRAIFRRTGGIGVQPGVSDVIFWSGSGSVGGPRQPILILPPGNDDQAHWAGMTLQLVRPDIRQSCILLAAVRS